MDQTLEGRLIELLNARLCHDLISPVSAVNNGIELIAELGEDPGGEAMALVATSAKEAARRLQFFRLAFGSGRLPSGAEAGVAEARAALLDLPVGERVTVNWPEGGGGRLPRQGSKIMVLLGLVALDCLGGAGRLSVNGTAVPGGLLWQAEAEGARAALAADMAVALGGQAKPEDLTAKTAPAAYAALLAQEIGGRIAAAPAPGGIRLECLIPVAS
ncbi:MAG TPA: histidine phosphotransferase family protein [Alphaproteobacteria bacterium]|jgi:histidine phosphotransferase ChpT